jgi:hypothetical protein
MSKIENGLVLISNKSGSENQGNIYDLDNNLVCQSITRKIGQNRQIARIYRYYDGIYINFFYYNGMWNYATTTELDNNKKCIRCKSSDNSKNIYRSLNSLLGDYEGLIDLFGKLNKKYNYGFLMCHPDVSINYSYNEEAKKPNYNETNYFEAILEVKLIHLYTFDRDRNREININIDGINGPEIYYDGIWKDYKLFEEISEMYPLIEVNYDSFINDIRNIIENKIEFPYYFKGITIEYGDKRENIIRPAFKIIKNIINSNADYHILDSVKRGDIVVLASLNELIKDRRSELKSFDILNCLIRFIENLEFYYKEAYVYKKFVNIPGIYRQTIYQLHGKYLMRRRLGEKFILDSQYIKKYILEMDNALLITLLRKYQKEFMVYY